MQRLVWWIAFVAFAAVVVAVWAASAANDRARTLHEARERLETTLLLLEEHADRAFETGDRLVRSLIAVAEGGDLESEAARARLHERLVDLIADSPQISSAWIMDTAGFTLAENWSHPPAIPGPIVDRDYYRAHLAGERGLFIGEQRMGVSSGRPRFTLSRPIPAADGSLRAIAVAGVFSEYFSEIYAGAGLAEGASLRMSRQDGATLAVWPRQATPAPERALRAERTLARYPVRLEVAAPLEPILAPWRTRAVLGGLAALLAVAGFGGLTWLGLRSAGREARTRDALEAANRDLEARVEARTADLQASERKLAAILDNATVAVFVMDERQHCIYMNPAAERLTGYSLAETAGRPLHDVVHHTRPDGRPYPLAECPIDQAAPANDRMQGEEIFVHKDGSFYPVAFTASPIREDSGRVVGTVIEARDIRDEKAQRARERMLMDELDHRIKNILATVQAIVAQGLREGADAAVRQTIEARLAALARAHGLLTDEAWRGARLDAVLTSALAPFGGDDAAGRFELDGDGAAPHLAARAVLALGMCLHELATNASKYGALSVPAGRVRLSWRVRRDGAGVRLRLCWRETGGPPVAPPERQGFGSRLIVRGIAHELGATVTLDYPRDGVVCDIDMPLDGAALAAE